MPQVYDATAEKYSQDYSVTLTLSYIMFNISFTMN
jgi:hypothetical protein